MGFTTVPMSWTSTHKWIVRNGNAETIDGQDLHELAHYLAQEETPNITTNTGASLMHFAALTPQSRILMTFLHHQGVDFQLAAHDGSTPLHWATRNPSKQAVKCLLEFGALAHLVDDE